MSDVTDDDLTRWERLCEAATPGPWEVADCGRESEVPEVIRRTADSSFSPVAVFADAYRSEWECPNFEANRPLIAESRTALPLLIAEVRRLRAAILSFGNGTDFDWGVLARIDELTTQNAELSARVAELTAESAELRGGIKKQCDFAERHGSW